MRDIKRMSASDHLQTLKKDLPPEVVDVVDTIIYTAGSYVDMNSEGVLAKIVKYATMIWDFIKRFTSHPSKEEQLATLEKYVRVVCPKKKVLSKTKSKSIEKYHKSLTTKRRSVEPHSYITDIHTLTASIVGCKIKSKKFVEALQYFDYDAFTFDDETPIEEPEDIIEQPIAETSNAIVPFPDENSSSEDDEGQSEDTSAEEEECGVPSPKVDDVCMMIASSVQDESGVLACIQERIKSSKIVVVAMN